MRDAADEGVPDLERALLHEHGGHRSTTLVEVGLQDGPPARPVGSPFSSARSATIRTVSSRPSRFALVFAETSTNSVSPPHSDGTRPRSTIWVRTRLGSASSLSILLTATTTGTPAALAWSSASTVCGITPSSAATTSTAMSVICAPRARIAVNASWPACR